MLDSSSALYIRRVPLSSLTAKVLITNEAPITYLILFYDFKSFHYVYKITADLLGSQNEGHQPFAKGPCHNVTV